MNRVPQVSLLLRDLGVPNYSDLKCTDEAPALVSHPSMHKPNQP